MFRHAISIKSLRIFIVEVFLTNGIADSYIEIASRGGYVSLACLRSDVLWRMNV